MDCARQEGRLTSGGPADRAKLAAIMARRYASRIARAAMAPARAFGRMRIRAPERLLIAPQDIRTADATRAEDIYAGYFAFGGRIVNTQGRSPFDLHPPSPEWARALNGFGWLRHLRAAETSLARVNARALVDDYLAARGRTGGETFDAATTARRILSWLSQATLVLEGAEAEFYHRFLRALARDAAQLQDALGATAGLARLQATMALAAYAMCADTPARFQTRASAQLADAIGGQILPDGGHVSRNPQALIDLLLDFLPLRQAYVARGAAPPPALLNAIDRVIPALRLLRHGDSSLALFNGMGVTAPDRLATVLHYDDARGAAPVSAPHSGYQRLEAADTIVIVDAGPPPPGPYSLDAHAGCLSFEMSSGLQRIVVNCGTPAVGGPSAREAARQTAAHSTLVLNDVSSCRIAPDAGMERIVAGQIVAGPTHVGMSRETLAEGALLDLSHDGYAQRFGLVHERRIALKADGAQLVGEDRLVVAGQTGQSAPETFALRFHLHPSVVAMRAGDDTAVVLDLADGQRWMFDAGGMDVGLEESVFFASPDGVRACQQIVVAGVAEAGLEVQWAFSRL
ncbi:MAG: heparinase II/III family protein [Methylobacteriaceae bacterium]|nr:heparinase II/III family protein [Rhodoblastus sp.]MCC0004571.1 heparinase II/III family protein [Methylobacteriaceae bacterium]